MARGKSRVERVQNTKPVETVVEEVVELLEEEINIGIEISEGDYKLFKTTVFQLDIHTPYVLDTNFKYSFVKVSNVDEGDFIVTDENSSDYFDGITVPSRSDIKLTDKRHLVFYSGSRPSVKVEWYK